MATPRTAGKPSRSAWSARQEVQSLALPTELLRQARANTRRFKGDLPFLTQLAKEIALTRAAELTLAYRSLVWVLPGYRQRRSARGTRVTGEMCVVFVVRRKRELAEDDQQHLPRWLVSYADKDGVRMPFALPTDVQDAAGYRGARAHADSGIWVQRPDWVPKSGHYTALVSLKHSSGKQTCLLSAQHVLSPFVDGAALRVRGGLDIMPLDAQGAQAAAPRLATSLDTGGLLRADEQPARPSFDVQLAEVTAAGLAQVKLHTALRKLHPTRPWVRTLDELQALDWAGHFELLTPDNHPKFPGRGALRLTLITLPATPHGIAYDMSCGGTLCSRQVYHAGLLGFNALDAGKPMQGDSGSPIVARHKDGSVSLAAMHIGGNDKGLSWAIPAWQLMNIADWARHPDGAALELIEPQG